MNALHERLRLVASRCRSRTAGSALVCACLLAAWLPGCPGDDDVGASAPSCDDGFTGRALEGDWTLTGSGERSGCDSRRLDGELTLRTSMPISVEAAPQATSGRATGPEPASDADAFVTRIERADYVLTLDPSASDDVQDAITLQGGANGSCVSFDLTEDLPGGDDLDYHFDGYIVDNDRARGEFWGSGPGDCDVEGEFELVVR